MQDTQQTLTRARDLHEYIQTGKILEALDEFYADDVRMQDGNQPPTVGLSANREREVQFLENIKDWKGFEVLSIAAEGDTSFAETTMEFTTQDGTEVRLEQIARARWQDGKIVDERFYAV